MTEQGNRIVPAATELFMKLGPKSVTMDQVSKHCGISKRTLYEQFSDKNELLQCCLDAINRQQSAMRQELKQESANMVDYLIQTVRQTILASLQFTPNFFPELQKYYPAVAAYQNQFSDKIIKHELVEILKQGIAEGLFRKQTRVEIVTPLLQVQLEALYFSDLLPKNGLGLSETMNTVIFTFMRGIATPAGLELIAGYEAEL